MHSLHFFYSVFYPPAIYEAGDYVDDTNHWLVVVLLIVVTSILDLVKAMLDRRSLSLVFLPQALIGR